MPSLASLSRFGVRPAITSPMVRADIPDADVVTHNDDDVGFLVLRRNWNHCSDNSQHNEGQHACTSLDHFIASLLVTSSLSGQIGCESRLHTTKAQMVGTGADFTLPPCANDIARAILVRAQKRTATVNFLLFVWLGGVVRRVWAAR